MGIMCGLKFEKPFIFGTLLCEQIQKQCMVLQHATYIVHVLYMYCTYMYLQIVKRHFYYPKVSVGQSESRECGCPEHQTI